MLMAMCSCVFDSKKGEMENTGLKIGDRLLPFELVMNDGSRLSTTDLEGKVSVLVFFRTTCIDCQNELPVIQKLYDEFGGDESVVIACVSTGEGNGIVSDYWANNDLTLPYSASTDKTLVESFGFKAVPQVYVSDKETTVRYIHSDNPIASLEQLENEVKILFEK